MTFEPIAVVGQSCVLPGALSPDELWEAVLAGKDLTGTAPPGRWGVPVESVLAAEGSDPADKSWHARGGFVTGFERVFRPGDYGVPAVEIAGLDPIFQWTLHCARAGLLEAGVDPSKENAVLGRAGIVFGNLAYYSKSVADFAGEIWSGRTPATDPRNRFTTGYPAHLAAKLLGLGAGSLALDAACASSLYAVAIAAAKLHDREADLMLAGGVCRPDNLLLHTGFTALRALSPSGVSRPFDASGDGLLPAEGAAFVVLKRLADAVKDGSNILAVIRGVGLGNDGRAKDLLSPAVSGQENALRAAYAAAGLEPGDVSLIECHATGTPLGDPIEIETLNRVFGDRDLAIGSLKSNMGHLITASGTAAMIKVIMAMKTGTRPPTAGLSDPIPALARSRFRALREPEAWLCDGPRRAGINNFGFGGNNAHLILEEWQGQKIARPRAKSPGKDAVAIVALEVSAAGAPGTEAFARALFTGEEVLSEREGKEPAGRGREIEIPFSELRFPPKDLSDSTGEQVAVYALAQRALARVKPAAPEKAGVMIGMQCSTESAQANFRARLSEWFPGRSRSWLDAAREAASYPWNAAGVIGCMPNILTNRINSHFDFRGPSFSVCAEELSGLAALELGVRSLRARELDIAVIGAADFSVEPAHEAAARAVLPEDRRRPGDAAVVLVLKRLADARRDGDEVFAILPGRRTPPVPASSGLMEGGAASLSGYPVSLELGLGDGALSITNRFGHAHAASGLLHAAAAALACRRRVMPAHKGPGRPWLPGKEPRAARVSVSALGGARSSVVLAEDPKFPVPPAALEPVPEIRVYSGESALELAAALKSETQTEDGTMRLALVFRNAAERAKQKENALDWLARNGADPVGPPREIARNVFFGPRPIEGRTAFVYTGAAAAYPGMGKELSSAFPEIVGRLHARFDRVREAASWIFEDRSSRKTSPPDPSNKLWGSTYMAHIHTGFSRDVLGLKPDAALGISSGETNSLYALGAWNDLDAMFDDILDSGLYTVELSGEFRAAREAWGLKLRPRWTNWSVRAPIDEVRKALAGERRAHLMIVNAPDDAMIGGHADACARIVDKLGRERASRVPFDLAIHCPVVKKFAAGWRKLHTRATKPVPGTRFYTNATGTSYTPTKKSVADALTVQAMTTVDFPRTVLNAWKDGARFFVEHGPRDFCAGWIGKILGDREHLTVSLDAVGRSSLLQACRASALLVCGGAPVDLSALRERLRELDEAANAGVAPSTTPVARFSPHRPVFRVPGPASLSPHEAGQDRASAPPGPGALPEGAPRGALSGNSTSAPQAPPVSPAPRLPAARAVSAPPAPAVPAARGAVAAMRDYYLRVAKMHDEFVANQRAMHERYLAASRGALGTGAAVAAPAAPPAGPPPPAARAPAAAPVAPPAARTAHLPGPKFSRRDLEVLSSGKISSVFGEAFEGQDAFARQVRMPEPPLLLADRVTGVDAEPRVMGKGTMWTETDVTWDSWYLHDGRMPAGIMVESGQADLLLISWMGVDFLNKGERIYRLLGCELTFHGSLPQPGDTLCYDIHVDGHADHQGTRLFFFHYDLRIDGEVRLSMRHGQAGFFTDEELANSQGIIDSIELSGSGDRPSDPPRIRCRKSAFSRRDLEALAAGDAFSCFGEGFELARVHTRTPRIASGKMLLIDEVPVCDPKGGPLGRGYLKATYKLAPDTWFFPGHFKNDPCMPGTLMIEGCFQAMAVYLTSMGFGIDRDGWRFEPVPEEKYLLKCRGQATPKSKEVVYEIFVREVHDGRTPTLYADVLASVDGHKVFLCKKLGLRLVQDWPMTGMRELMELAAETRPAHREDGFEFGYKSAIACAWGPPSFAFGKVYAEAERTGRRVPRLPGPPFHFITRAVRVSDRSGVPKTGVTCEIEYEIPPDAWYFQGTNHPSMPHCVLAEAALQTCGWISSFEGIGSDEDGEFFFRNLDGKGIIHAEIPRDAGILRTVTTITAISKAGGMIVEGFESKSYVGEALVYELKSVFGHFPKEALANQVGMPPSDEDRRALAAPSDYRVEFAERPAKFFGGTARLPDSRLLALHRVSGFWPGGGKKGLGRLRAEHDVDPGAWFFKAHFYQDPVQPGSMGYEMMLQLLQVFMLETGMDKGVPGARFQHVATGQTLHWKYRGQVVPKDERVTVEMDITETGTDAEGPYAVADGWLWVDGRRIYRIERIAMRIVGGGSPPEAKAASARSETLDRAREPWIEDHKPTHTRPALPMMFMADRLAGAVAAARPGKRIVGMRDVRVDGWLLLDEPKTLTTEVRETAPGEFFVELFAAPSGAGPMRAASGTVLVADAYADPPAPWEPLAGLASVDPLPYETGVLFHGPSFRVLRSLKTGRGGAGGVLSAGSRIPFGTLNQVLLDGAFHVLPNDDFSVFAAGLPGDRIAYPLKIESFSIFGPAPRAGEVNCEARYAGRQGGKSSGIIRNRIQYAAGGRVWAEMSLLSILVPKGRMQLLPAAERKDFLTGARPAAGPILTVRQGKKSLLDAAEVSALGWFPGIIEDVYGAQGSPREVVEAVAAKEHVAAAEGVHPREVSYAGGSARSARTPLNTVPLAVVKRKGGVSVETAGEPFLDLEPVFAEAAPLTGGRFPFLEDFFRALAGKFVGRVILSGPGVLETLRGRAALQLSNYQCRIESILTPFLLTHLTKSPTTVLAKTDHKRKFIGKLIEFIDGCPGYRSPTPNLFVDKADPADFLRVAEEMGRRFRNGHSVMLHVEGTRQLSCRARVTKMSSVFTDLAIREGVPVIPVKYAGGLPVEPLERGLVFPYGFTKQDYWIGEPIEPAELAALAPKDRKARVLGAINALGPEDEVPVCGGWDFDAAVFDWVKRTGARASMAAILLLLEELEDPCEETCMILDGKKKGRLKLSDTDTGRWLAAFARELYGPQGPSVTI